MSISYLELLLIGKPGCGKSSTGNSILNKSVFSVTNTTQARCVSCPAREVTQHESLHLAVLDGLDIIHCGENADFNPVENMIRLSGEGFNAILIVLCFGERFRNEDRKVIEMTKSIFGEDVIKQFGVLTFTHGDNFQTETAEESYRTLNEYLDQETGELYKLYEECNKRCILFDNKTKDDKTKKETLHELIKLLKQPQLKQKRYIRDYYECSEVSRNNLVLRKKSIDMREEFEVKLQDINTRITKADEKCNAKELEMIKKELLSFLSQLQRDFGTDSPYSKEMENKTNVAISLVTGKLNSLMSRKDNHTSELTHNYVYCKRTTSGPMTEKPVGDLSDNQSHVKLKFKNIHDAEETLIVLYKDILKHAIEDKSKEEIITKLSALENNRSFKMFGENECTVLCPTQPTSKPTELWNPIKASPPNCITFFLWGCAGYGKSATGNSILGTPAFSTSTKTSRNKASCMKGSAIIDSKLIQVIDSPGVSLTGSSDVSLTRAMKIVDEALQLCDYNFSALVIVLKYGERYTKQESETIENIKAILGKDVIKQYGICVVTHGDNFVDNDDERTPFVEWCNQQEGEVQRLFQECDHRCALFNNKSKDLETKSAQNNQLLKLVPCQRDYSRHDFAHASKNINTIIIQKEMPKVIEETNVFLDGKHKDLKDIESMVDKTKQHKTLLTIKEDVNSFRDMLYKKYKGLTNSHAPIQQLEIILIEIESKIKVCTERRDQWMPYSQANAMTSSQLCPVKRHQSVGDKETHQHHSYRSLQNGQAKCCRSSSYQSQQHRKADNGKNDSQELYNKWYSMNDEIAQVKKGRESLELKSILDRFHLLKNETQIKMIDYDKDISTHLNNLMDTTYILIQNKL